MKYYAWLTAALFVVFLGLFALVEALGVPVLTDPRPLMAGGAWAAAALGVGLLVADVLIPVPASLVMVAHGALFGVPVGAALSLLGGLGASWAGFAIGRRGGVLLARLAPPAERRRAEELLGRWGSLAVLVTRPVPLLAEIVAILAGTSAMSWSRLTWASVAGTLPAALLYALTGATAHDLDSALLVFGLVLAVAGLAWWIGRHAPSARGDASAEGTDL